MWLRLRITPPGPTATTTSAPAGRGGPASAVVTRVRADASVEEVLDRLRRAAGPDRQGVQGSRLKLEPPERLLTHPHAVYMGHYGGHPPSFPEF